MKYSPEYCPTPTAFDLRLGRFGSWTRTCLGKVTDSAWLKATSGPRSLRCSFAEGEFWSRLDSPEALGASGGSVGSFGRTLCRRVLPNARHRHSALSRERTKRPTFGRWAIAAAGLLRTSVGMTTYLESSVHPGLQNFVPLNLDADQWRRFACPVSALVTQVEPRNEADAEQLASTLCDLLSSRLALRAEANWGELFTSQTIRHHVIGLEMRDGAIVASTAYARLQRLLYAYQGFQPVLEHREENAFGAALDGRAIEELRSRINESPSEICAVLGRCLIVGLASGFQARDASKASVAIASNGGIEIQHRGRSREVLDRFIPEIRKMWRLDPICQYLDFEIADHWWQENFGIWPDDLIRRCWAVAEIAAIADFMALPFEERFERKFVFHVQGELALDLDDVLGT
jgi:hypothetical protein